MILYYLMPLLLVFLSAIAILIIFKNLLHPISILTILYSFAILVSILFERYFNPSFISISIIYISLFTMSIGGVIASSLLKKKHIIKSEKKLINYKFSSLSFYMLHTLYLLVLIVVWYYFALNAIDFISKGVGLGDYIYLRRIQSLSGIRIISDSLYRVYVNIQLFAYPLILITIYIGLISKMKKYILLSFFLLFPIVLIDFIMGSRGNYIFTIMSIIFLLRYLNFINIKQIIVVFVLLIILFIFTGQLRSEFSFNRFVDYFSGPVIAFSQFIENSDSIHIGNTFGFFQKTFDFITFNLKDPVNYSYNMPGVIDSSVSISNVSSVNVYTQFAVVIKNLGFIGLFIYSLISGLFISFLFERRHKMIYLILLAYYVPFFIFGFFHEFLANEFAVIFRFIILYILIRLKFKIKYSHAL